MKVQRVVVSSVFLGQVVSSQNGLASPLLRRPWGQIEVLGGRDSQALGHFLEPSFCNGNESNTYLLLLLKKCGLL